MPRHDDVSYVRIVGSKVLASRDEVSVGENGRLATRRFEGLEVRFVLAGEVCRLASGCGDSFGALPLQAASKVPAKKMSSKLQCCPMSIGYFCWRQLIGAAALYSVPGSPTGS